MPMRQASRQMPAKLGQPGVRGGEAALGLGSEDACGPRHETRNTASGLPETALTNENLQRAWKRGRANPGAAGSDGLDMSQTAARLRSAWPSIREQLVSGTYRPQPVRRVTISKPEGGD